MIRGFYLSSCISCLLCVSWRLCLSFPQSLLCPQKSCVYLLFSYWSSSSLLHQSWQHVFTHCANIQQQKNNIWDWSLASTHINSLVCMHTPIGACEQRTNINWNFQEVMKTNNKWTVMGTNAYSMLRLNIITTTLKSIQGHSHFMQKKFRFTR